jgi:hypothetical protein
MSTKQKKISLRRLTSTVLVIAALLVQFVPFQPAGAAGPLASRKLTLGAGSTGDPGTEVGGTVDHSFNFNIVAATATIGSIRVLYCTTASPVDSTETDRTQDCTAPTALDAETGVTITNPSGEATGFSIDGVNSTASNIVLTRTAAEATGIGVPQTIHIGFTLHDATNTSTMGTFFARLFVYTSEDGGVALSDAPTYEDTVAASTALTIHIQGYMPESLVFCTGATVTRTADVPDCSSATEGTVSFNKLFSPQDTASTTSQMAASTNAGSGYAITVHGLTMMNGSSDEITEMYNAGAAVDPAWGVSQFGLNVVANTGVNTTPDPDLTYSATAFGHDIDGDGGTPLAGGTYNGRAATGYNTADKFQYRNTDIVADSNSTTSDAQIYTVSYIVNVTGSQPAGSYATNLTYICTPTF